jgi:hypothetical protein
MIEFFDMTAPIFTRSFAAQFALGNLRNTGNFAFACR